MLALTVILSASVAHAKSKPAPAPAATPAKIQFFVNYKKPNQTTFSSTARAPLSAIYLMDHHAICYKGSFLQVADLFSDMIEIFHAQNPGAKMKGKISTFQAADGKRYLKIQFKRAGYTFGYPKVRDCVR